MYASDRKHLWIAYSVLAQKVNTLFVEYTCLSDVCMLLHTHRPTERLSIEVARATKRVLRVFLLLKGAGTPHLFRGIQNSPQCIEVSA